MSMYAHHFTLQNTQWIQDDGKMLFVVPTVKPEWIEAISDHQWIAAPRWRPSVQGNMPT